MCPHIRFRGVALLQRGITWGKHGSGGIACLCGVVWSVGDDSMAYAFMFPACLRSWACLPGV